MKKIVVIVLIVLAIGVILGFSVLNKSNNQDKQIENVVKNETEEVESTITQRNNILIAYYSRTGNTQTIANYINQAIGGDTFEIKTVNTYPEDYVEMKEIAKQEQEENARPELKSKIDNLDKYDTIFVGYPIWYGTMPMGVFTFLEQNDFSGKTVIPFCTHGGSGFGNSEEDIKNTIPKANIIKGLSFRGDDVELDETKTEVAEWIRKLDIKK